MTFFDLIFAWILLAVAAGNPQPTHTVQDHGMQVSQGCKTWACQVGGQGR